LFIDWKKVLSLKGTDEQYLLTCKTKKEK